MVLLVTNKGKE